jgi:hypothetical protein
MGIAKLQREHDLFWSKNGKRIAVDGAESATYAEWSRQPELRPWKLGWWDSERDEATSSASLARDQFGVAEIEDFIDCAENDYLAGDWVLCFKLTAAGASRVGWMLVQVVHRLAVNEIDADSPELTHQALQISKLSQYNRPPFRLDRAFKRAFSTAVRSYGIGKLMQRASTRVPVGLFARLGEDLL